jgi:hypothetical protein
MRALRFSDFAVGESFAVRAGDSEIELKLEAADELPQQVREEGSFRLLFAGPPDPLLPQAIYAMKRGEETLEIFIVPIAREPDGIRYEAIFN